MGRAAAITQPDDATGPQWFKCQLLGLAYEDPNTNVLIATVKDSIAQVVGHQVVYVDAFDGVRADVRLTYSAAGVMQEVLLREQMPDPDAWGLNPASARLTAITEVVEGPPPQIIARVWPAGGQTLRDQTLDFGPMRLVPGRGFGIRGGNPSQLSWVPVTKEYGTVQGRRILLEQLRYSAIQDELLRLPAPGATTNSPTGASLKQASRWLARMDSTTAPPAEPERSAGLQPALERGRLARGRGSVPADLEIGAPSAGRSAGGPPALRSPSPSLAATPVGPRRSGLANPSAWLAALPPAPPAPQTPAPPVRPLAALAQPDGFLLDWNLVNRGLHDFTFACAASATYLVRGELHLSGTTTFSPGAVLKYYAESSLYLDGPLNFVAADPVGGSAQALLTSVNDRSAGELLPSRAPAWEGEFGPALVVGPGDYAPALQHLEARYARPGIIPNDPTTLPTVSVAATAPQAGRVGARAGAFTIRRAPGDWSQPLTVRFRLAGSAQPGVDFQDLGATATIPAHQGDVAVAIRPLGAGARAASVTLTLEPEAAYLPDAPQTATVSILGANGPLSAVPAPSGLVAWWPGENNANDVVGGNNGTLFNGAGYAPGEVGQAFAVNGANQYVQVPDAPALNPTNALTLETWVYVAALPPSADAVILVGKQDASTLQYQLALGHGPGYWAFRSLVILQGGIWAYCYGNTVVQPQTWYHLALTHDGATLQQYVNGAVDGGVPASGPIQATTRPLVIGGWSAHWWNLNGEVDEPSLYHRALSQSEIQSIYNAGPAGKTLGGGPPPSGCWTCIGTAASSPARRTQTGLNPDFETEWRALQPRARFSAPSRKTPRGEKCSRTGPPRRGPQVRHARAHPATPGGGRAPRLRSSG